MSTKHYQFFPPLASIEQNISYLVWASYFGKKKVIIFVTLYIPYSAFLYQYGFRFWSFFSVIVTLYLILPHTHTHTHTHTHMPGLYSPTVSRRFFAKLLIVIISFIVSVCLAIRPSVRKERLGSYWIILKKILFENFSRKSAEKIQDPWKYGENIWSFTMETYVHL